jgi:anti-anti-sigma factor
VTDDYFTISTGPAEPGADGVPTFRVRLAGSFDIGAGGRLRDALSEVVEAGAGARIVVDLSRVRFIDSEAVNALIAGYVAADRAGLSFRLAGAVGIVERVVTVIGLSHLLDVPST